MKSKEEILDELVPDDQVKMAQGSYQPGDKVLIRDASGGKFKATLIRLSESDGRPGWAIKPDPDAIEVSPREDDQGNPWIEEIDIVSKI